MIKTKEELLSELLDLLTLVNKKNQWQEILNTKIFVSIKTINGKKFKMWRILEVTQKEVVLSNCYYSKETKNIQKILLKDISSLKIIFKN